MKTEIEFTDRYGGNTPSWLRSCHGDCEAMGYVPISNPNPNREGARIVHDKWQEYYYNAWREAEAKKSSDDGWHFVKCPECKGTGRVSWATAITRIPIWFWKGLVFLWKSPSGREDWSWWKNFSLKCRCAWWLDLKRLFN